MTTSSGAGLAVSCFSVLFLSDSGFVVCCYVLPFCAALIRLGCAGGAASSARFCGLPWRDSVSHQVVTLAFGVKHTPKNEVLYIANELIPVI